MEIPCKLQFAVAFLIKKTILLFVGFLTTGLILIACKGGGEGSIYSGPQGIAGASGNVCVTGDSSYRIEVEGEDARNLNIAVDPLAQAYQGNIGGQIRAVSSINIALANQPVKDVLVWGSGASVKFGLPGEIIGTTPFKRPGAVTSISAYREGDAAKLVYGSERGIGLLHSTGNTIEEEYSNYKMIPGGVLSVAVAGAGGRIGFVSGDGLVQTTSASKISSGDSCAEILATQSVLRVGDVTYMPRKIVLGGKFAFVLAELPGSRPLSMAPTFEEIYDPIFTAIIKGISNRIVRAVELNDHMVYEVVPETSDGSLKHYDSFIPTDIAMDGEELYVVGVTYNRATVQEFLAANCSASDEAGQVACLREKSRDDGFVRFQSDGKYAVNAGYFIYRSMNDLSKAAHFESVPLAAFAAAPSAPPFMYKIVFGGGNGFIRGPNFLVSMAVSSTVSGLEEWNFTRQVDVSDGLAAGVPNDIVPFAGGVAASFTAVRAADNSGASFLEAMEANGTLSQMDSGTIFARVEGGAESRVAVIETTGQGGGNLFIENAVVRTPIADLAASGAFVSQAAYDGDMLAFAWSKRGTALAPEGEQGWNITVQHGTNASTRGTQFVPRSSDPKIFAGFPAIASNDPAPGVKRGVADIALGEGQRLFVLFSGYAEGHWHHQLVVYNVVRPSSGPYEIVTSGIMNAVSSEGSADAHDGKILKVEKSDSVYTVKFSTAGGIYSWVVEPQASTAVAVGACTREIGLPGLLDATRDAYGSNKIALLYGDKIHIRDLSNLSVDVSQFGVPPGSTGSETTLAGARMSLAGNTLAIAAPYGAQAPFLMYDLSSAALYSYCTQCTFLDVKVFNSFRNYLLASSISSGVEIYSIGE